MVMNDILKNVKIGEIIDFGFYPQSVKEDDVVVSDTVNENGYYLGSDGECYSKIVATPYNTNYKFSNGTIITKGNEYYFKVEPIKWIVLSKDSETLSVLCTNIIDGRVFSTIPQTYMDSEIRAWLNAEFYNLAFNEIQKKLIAVTTVNNTKASTGHSSNKNACKNTKDKIYLLSKQEACNLDNQNEGRSSVRERIASDYARATGVGILTTLDRYGNGAWWLRSPYHASINYAWIGNTDGSIFYSFQTSVKGIVPVLQISVK
ncbi:MAG: hypothetical protein IKJ19_07485 [Clostridia bacterium]|nr:hypothetical protein [Clostridia bacterium]